MPGNRIFIKIIVGLLFVAAAGKLAPPWPWISTGVDENAFWISKAFNTKRYEMVLAGDSRVLKGLSPAAIETILPQTRIFNFGFDHNAYTKDYLTAIENLLAPDSQCKIILLGISPQSLTLEAASRNGFLSLRQNSAFERFTQLHLSKYLDFFRPYNLYYFWNNLIGQPNIKYYQHFYADGWVASRKIPEDPEYQINRYRGRFDNNTVSSKLTRQLLDYVQLWRKKGILVFGLRMPSSPAMVKLENQQSGFRQDEFAAAFMQAGGIWLDFDLVGYHSYDGSHLREDAAIEFSRDVAERILRFAARTHSGPHAVCFKDEHRDEDAIVSR